MPPRTYQYVLVLMCAVALIGYSECTAVNATQRLIMDELVKEWPSLANLRVGPWTPKGMDLACSQSAQSAYGVICDDTGWITSLVWDDIGGNLQNGHSLGPSAFSLSLFSRLESVSISNAGLRGPLQPSWSSLSELQHISITNEPELGKMPENNHTRTKSASQEAKNFRPLGFPFSWRSLSKLRTIRFHNLPSFECGLPPSIHRNWPLLKSLEISNTLCTGSIPPSLFWTPLSLSNISLPDNQFTGYLPLVLATRNQTYDTLDVARNLLTGILPKNWNRAPASRLSLSGNLFSGSLPRWIGTPNSRYNGAKQEGPITQIVDFSRNAFTGSMTQSLIDSRIKDLLLDINQLSGPLLLPTSEDCALRKISVSDNYLSGPLPAALWNGSKVEYIDASDNELTGPFPGTPKDYDEDADGEEDEEEVEYDMVRGPPVAPIPKPRSFAMSQILESRKRQQTPKTSPNEIFSFIPAPTTRDSSSNGAGVTRRDEIIEYEILSPTCYLTHLVLSDNPLNARLPNSLGNCILTLERLEIANAGLKGTISEHFTRIEQRIIIILEDGTPIDEDIIWIEPLTSPLAHINFSTNYLRGRLPYLFEFFDESRMYPSGSELILSADANRFEGALPAGYFNNSRYFVYFNVSYNRLNLCEERGKAWKLGFGICDASAQFPPACGCPGLWFPKCLPKEMRPKCLTLREAVMHSAFLGIALLISLSYLGFKEFNRARYN